jgi:hypothetical protein
VFSFRNLKKGKKRARNNEHIKHENSFEKQNKIIQNYITNSHAIFGKYTCKISRCS